MNIQVLIIAIIVGIVIWMWYRNGVKEKYVSALTLPTAIQPFMHNQSSAVFDPEQFSTFKSTEPFSTFKSTEQYKPLSANNLKSILIEPTPNEGIESVVDFSNVSFSPNAIPLKTKSKISNVDYFSDGKKVKAVITPVYSGAYQITYVLNVYKPDGTLEMIDFGNSKEKAQAMWKSRYPQMPIPEIIA